MDVIDQAVRDASQLRGWPSGWEQRFGRLPVGDPAGLVVWLSVEAWRPSGTTALCALVELARTGDGAAVVVLLAVFGRRLRRVSADTGCDLDAAIVEFVEVVHRIRVRADWPMALNIVRRTARAAGRPVWRLQAREVLTGEFDRSRPAPGRVVAGDAVEDAVEDRAVVAGLLAGLAADERELIVRTRVCGEDLGSVARAMGRSVDGAYKRRARAERGLRAGFVAAAA